MTVNDWLAILLPGVTLDEGAISDLSSQCERLYNLRAAAEYGYDIDRLKAAVCCCQSRPNSSRRHKRKCSRCCKSPGRESCGDIHRSRAKVWLAGYAVGAGVFRRNGGFDRRLHPYRSRLLTGFYSKKCDWPAWPSAIKRGSTLDFEDKYSDI